ncbi:MAG: prepilin-type N-terminal cleavage/methylation domain-containing protein [Fusobacteriaceae bacterium]|jgi:prepilin-type N-terminal cleavage/methylation domain-containing protein|nr:prepilin-type N-terminal cleavage/methylation domain-containing protein [Fusobacteriaceae bacterium]
MTKQKKKGMTFTEVVVAMAIFLIAVIPVQQWNGKLLTANRALGQMEAEAMVFQNIVSFTSSRDYAAFQVRTGEYAYDLPEQDERLVLSPADELTEGFQSKQTNLAGLRLKIVIGDLSLEDPVKKEEIKQVEWILYGKKRIYRQKGLFLPNPIKDGA